MTDSYGFISKYNMEPLSPGYFLQAVDAYRQHFAHPVFIFVSDDINWVEKFIFPRRGSAVFVLGSEGKD